MAAMHVAPHLAVADLLSCFGVQCRSGVWVAEGWGSGVARWATRLKAVAKGKAEPASQFARRARNVPQRQEKEKKRLKCVVVELKQPGLVQSSNASTSRTVDAHRRRRDGWKKGAQPIATDSSSDTHSDDDESEVSALSLARLQQGRSGGRDEAIRRGN